MVGLSICFFFSFIFILGTILIKDFGVKSKQYCKLSFIVKTLIIFVVSAITGMNIRKVYHAGLPAEKINNLNGYRCLTVQFPLMNAELHYSLSGHNSDLFFIEPSGTLFTLSTIQNMEDIVITVHVEDNGENPKSDTTTVSVRFQNISDFPEMKVDVLSSSLSEDEPVGALVALVSAVSIRAEPISLYIAAGNFEDIFHVDQSSGALTLEKSLDYENRQEFTLLIEARDSGSPPFSSFLEVHLNVTDVNDNYPQFTQAEYRCEIFENLAPSTVCEVFAIDADSLSFSAVRYGIIEGNDEEYFTIDPDNGLLSTTVSLDRETIAVYTLTVEAVESDNPLHKDTAKIILLILDKNDNAPQFPQTYFAQVSEDVPVGHTVIQVTSTDDDSNSVITYSMVGQSEAAPFSINFRTGWITVETLLDREAQDHYILKIHASDSAWSVSANVTIIISDVNDNSPKFIDHIFTAVLTETKEKDTFVLQVVATDADIGKNSDIFYIIDPPNPLSGVISVNSHLDRELWSIYNLTVAAIDNGSPPATGTTNVIVTIRDVNDNVMENQPEGTVVTRLNAFDSDLPPNQGPFTYWLLNQSSSSAFLLTADGVLLTTKSLDRERISAYRILVVVEDAGFPMPLSSTTAIHIKVLDENDNPPLPRNIFIEVKYFGSSFQGGMIGNVHPEDHDEFDTFSCVIRNGPVNMFSIPNGTCELWSSPFQGEATFNVTVEAADELQFTVNNSIYVNYKGFTNASINSCILFYVSLSSMEEFLSSKYLRFVKALDSLFNLQASKTHVFGIKQIGKEILLLAAVKNYNGQYLSKEVASGISTGHKKSLEAQSNVTISHITSDPCITNPCQNKATCSKNIYISQEVAVLESMAVIFVSPQKEIFNCTCPSGFSGSFCEDDIDECEVNPCKNNGTCENTAGGFICHCPAGFSGTFCSADVDECLRVKCQNGGTCVASDNGSYCHCVPGFEGKFILQSKDFCPG
uniref:Uncharacterized protein n=1 Tax=Oryzias melastigma TaxID=30732 RepID=A0A3B3B9K3_ORYME